jgi:uncharacterized membrane protein
MKLGRIIRHLLITRWHVGLTFPPRTLRAIEKAVRDSHKEHIGQVRFVVEGALHITALLHGLSARERAIDVFSELRVWDTEHNNGVLVYLLLADRDVEIIADRGVNARVRGADWQAICHNMEVDFRGGNYEAGAIRGIGEVTELLKKHFPVQQEREDELPSKPAIL